MFDEIGAVTHLHKKVVIVVEEDFATRGGPALPVSRFRASSRGWLWRMITSMAAWSLMPAISYP